MIYFSLIILDKNGEKSLMFVGKSSVGRMNVVVFGPIFPNRYDTPKTIMKRSISVLRNEYSTPSTIYAAAITAKPTHCRSLLPALSMSPTAIQYPGSAKAPASIVSPIAVLNMVVLREVEEPYPIC